MASAQAAKKHEPILHLHPSFNCTHDCYCSIPPVYRKLSALQRAEPSACWEGQGTTGDAYQHLEKGVKVSVSLVPLLTLLPHQRCLLSAGLWLRSWEWDLP